MNKRPSIQVHYLAALGVLPALYPAGVALADGAAPSESGAEAAIHGSFNTGEDINQMTLHYFVNYNIADGWYLSTAPIITANREAERSADTWTVPIGGGFGKLWRLGKLPVNTQVQAYWNAEKPRYGSDWTLRTQLQFLFPK